MKAIYKITNVTNGKIYIGQSKDPVRRFKQHMSKHSDSLLLSKDVRLHGKEAFIMEVLEWTSNYMVRESYYINKYNSTNKELGYNISVGGNSNIIHPDELIETIHDDIVNTDLTYLEISDKHNISISTIRQYSYGVRKLDGYNYPLRRYDMSEETVNKIAYDLYYTDKPIKQIADEHNVSVPGVKHISNGTRNFNEDWNYPLRTRGKLRRVEKVKYFLREGMSNKWISDKVGMSTGTISKINTGYNYYDEEEKYPIRG